MNYHLPAKWFVGLAVDEAAPGHATLTMFKNRLIAGKGEQVFLVLFHLLRGRTSFVIVLDEGEMVEEGTHQELLALGGLYATVYTASYATVGAPGRDGGSSEAIHTQEVTRA